MAETVGTSIWKAAARVTNRHAHAKKRNQEQNDVHGAFSKNEQLTAKKFSLEPRAIRTDTSPLLHRLLKTRDFQQQAVYLSRLPLDPVPTARRTKISHEWIKNAMTACFSVYIGCTCSCAAREEFAAPHQVRGRLSKCYFR